MKKVIRFKENDIEKLVKKIGKTKGTFFNPIYKKKKND